MNDDSHQPPKPSKLDKLHATSRSALAAIPVLGGSASEIFNAVLQPPLEARRDEWRERVGKALDDLLKNGLTIENLIKNEQFISIVTYATQIALRTHKEDKLSALQNAVVNVASGTKLDEDLQHMFLNLVDELTPRHVSILKFSQAPIVPQNTSMGGLSIVLEGQFPELRGRKDFYNQIWRDLYARGLVNTENLHVMMSGQGLQAKRTTTLGDQFLDFITSTDD